MARAFETSHKCLIDIVGTPMIARVLDTLLSSDRIGNIIISIEHREIIESNGEVAKRLTKSGVSICESLPHASASVAAAIDFSGGAFPYLLVTADHALLSHDMLDHVCRASEAAGGDIAVALARDDVIEARYPQTRRTYLRFADGRFSGCNLFVLKTPGARAALGFWQHIERERKAPWRLARAFGFRTLFAYLTGRLSLARAMASASRVIGTTANAIEVPIAEAAIDVDKSDDLALVREIIQARKDAQQAG